MNLQLPLVEPRSQAIRAAVESLADDGDAVERGAVFTKLGVVEAILDLCGYTEGGQLEERRLLEPSFGNGDFLLEAMRRLVASYKLSGASMAAAPRRLADALRGVELHRATFEATFSRAVAQLAEAGVSKLAAERLVTRWLRNDDFLLADMSGSFDFVVGNPPYVRQERIPEALLNEYRRRYATLYDRADLYVLFYEKGLDLLATDGSLGFICANRWIKNKYGGPLRQKIGEGFSLKFFIDLERADAFTSEVIAYPAITVIERRAAATTYVALNHKHSSRGLADVVQSLTAADSLTAANSLTGADNGRPASRTTAAPKSATDGRASERSRIEKLKNVANGRDPWLLDTPRVLNMIRELERRFPTIEEADSKIGIGVATGADRVFIGEYEDLPVEQTRKLRLAMAADCADGVIRWGGKGVVNPYLATGQLASFAKFPRFAHYMEENERALKKRHTAKNQPHRWYKTIDRIYPDLAAKPKLLIPDIKGAATVAYDDGSCYPHHNLYVITSEHWNLRALQAVLRSSVALMFVAAYGVKMAGGFLRFQAQYLRRIRCPKWSDLSDKARQDLIDVSVEQDQAAVDAIVSPLYRLSKADAKAISAYAQAARVRRAGT